MQQQTTRKTDNAAGWGKRGVAKGSTILVPPRGREADAAVAVAFRSCSCNCNARVCSQSHSQK